MNQILQWLTLAALVSLLCVLFVVQQIARHDCRQRGGVPVLEMWGRIACAKPMEKL